MKPDQSLIGSPQCVGLRAQTPVDEVAQRHVGQKFLPVMSGGEQIVIKAGYLALVSTVQHFDKRVAARVATDIEKPVGQYKVGLFGLLVVMRVLRGKAVGHAQIGMGVAWLPAGADVRPHLGRFVHGYDGKAVLRAQKVGIGFRKADMALQCLNSWLRR